MTKKGENRVQLIGYMIKFGQNNFNFCKKNVNSRNVMYWELFKKEDIGVILMGRYFK